MDANQLAISIEEARKMLGGISRGLMYEAVRCGRIPSFRVGRRILIPISALRRKLENAGIQNEDAAAKGANDG